MKALPGSTGQIPGEGTIGCHRAGQSPKSPENVVGAVMRAAGLLQADEVYHTGSASSWRGVCHRHRR